MSTSWILESERLRVPRRRRPCQSRLRLPCARNPHASLRRQQTGQDLRRLPRSHAIPVIAVALPSRTEASDSPGCGSPVGRRLSNVKNRLAVQILPANPVTHRLLSLAVTETNLLLDEMFVRHPRQQVKYPLTGLPRYLRRKRRRGKQLALVGSESGCYRR